jgi:hypothetical protein
VVDTLRNHGALLRSEHLIDGSADLYTHTRASKEKQGILRARFFMVHHLVRAGVAVDSLALEHLEKRASRVLKARHDFHKAHACVSDGAMVTVLVAREAMRSVSQRELKRFGSIKLLLKLVLNGKMKVPTMPLPFEEMAREVCDWMVAMD